MATSAATVQAQSPQPHAKYERLIARAKTVPPATTLVVHPCDETSLRGAIEAAEAGIIVPILVGPAAKITAVARKHSLDIAKYEIVDVAHSEAAAAKGVELIHAGKGELLMKGSLHTDELMRAVTASTTGLRTAPPHQPRLRHGCAGLSGHAVHHRCGDQHRSRSRCQARHRPERHRSVDPVAASARRASRFSRRSRPSPRRFRRPSRRRLCARWPTAARSPAAFSTGRLPSTMRSIRKPRGSRASSRRSPDVRRSWSCPISRPATCWPRIYRSCRRRTPRASCSARGCRSF